MIPNNQRLSDEELRKLIELYKRTKNSGEVRTRIHCVILWGKGYSWETIKDVLMISDGMIQEVIEKYKIFGVDVLIENHYEGHHNKMTKEEEKAVIQFVKDNFVRDTKVVINWIKEHFGKVYTTQGLESVVDLLKK